MIARESTSTDIIHSHSHNISEMPGQLFYKIKPGNLASLGFSMRSWRKWTAPAMPSNKLRGLSGMFCSGLTSSVSHSPNLAAL